MKTCLRCSKIKEFCDFSKKSRNKDGLSNWCKSCEKNYCDSVRQKLRENDKRSYLKNREKRIAKSMVYNYKKLGLQLTQKIKDYLTSKKEKKPFSYEEYKIRYAPIHAEYRNKNKDKIKKQNRLYLSSEHGKLVSRLKTSRYRARKENLPSSLTKGHVEFLIKKQKNMCGCCGVVFGEGLSKMEIDHIDPVSKGGGLVFENVQLLCRSCNARKRDMHIRYIPVFSLGEK